MTMLIFVARNIAIHLLEHSNRMTSIEFRQHMPQVEHRHHRRRRFRISRHND
jgi:hypothetical protein